MAAVETDAVRDLRCVLPASGYGAVADFGVATACVMGEASAVDAVAQGGHCYGMVAGWADRKTLEDADKLWVLFGAGVELVHAGPDLHGDADTVLIDACHYQVYFCWKKIC
mmetsp:Transcript_29099/g.40914  ORF Transcript_29099/g.40914 Transcript_29099/m.40914 type:complete len:111 (-) Transcript_29099:1465-1797(-)